MQANRSRNSSAPLLSLIVVAFCLFSAFSAQAQEMKLFGPEKENSAAAWQDKESGAYFSQTPHPAFGGYSFGSDAVSMEKIEPAAGEDRSGEACAHVPDSTPAQAFSVCRE